MSTEQNKALVRRFVEEVWNKGNIPATDGFFTADFVDHNPAAARLASGIEGAKQVFTMYREAFPDLHLTIEDMVAEGDKVVWRWTSHGTHQGSLLDIPATGKHTIVTGIDIYHIGGGKIAERWGNFDQLGLLQQLGVVPPPPGQGG